VLLVLLIIGCFPFPCTAEGDLSLLHFSALRAYTGEKICPAGEFCRIAVFSFFNATKDGTLQWLSQEFVDAIREKLGGSAGLGFVGADVMKIQERKLKRAKGGEVNKARLVHLGQRMNADVVVVGKYDFQREDIRVEVQAIQIAQGRRSELVSFQGNRNKIPRIEVSLASRLATLLGVNLDETTKERVMRVPTESHAAFEAFCRGKQSPDGSFGRVQYFQKAIEIDPDFIEAHYLLARSYGAIAATYQYKEWMDRAIGEYEKVLSLSPHAVDVYCDMAQACILRERYDDAERALSKALEIDPQNSVARSYLDRLKSMGH
jgi:hypothetical protein